MQHQHVQQHNSVNQAAMTLFQKYLVQPAKRQVRNFFQHALADPKQTLAAYSSMSTRDFDKWNAARRTELFLSHRSIVLLLNNCERHFRVLNLNGRLNSFFDLPQIQEDVIRTAETFQLDLVSKAEGSRHISGHCKSASKDAKRIVRELRELLSSTELVLTRDWLRKYFRRSAKGTLETNIQTLAFLRNLEGPNAQILILHFEITRDNSSGRRLHYRYCGLAFNLDLFKTKLDKIEEDLRYEYSEKEAKRCAQPTDNAGVLTSIKSLWISMKNIFQQPESNCGYDFGDGWIQVFSRVNVNNILFDDKLILKYIYNFPQKD